MSARQKVVRIFNGALDDVEGDIVLRGRIDPESLDALQVDDYQREVLPLSTIHGIMKGFEEGSTVPDIHLSMRGHKTTDNGHTFMLHDPVFVVDGQQRVSAARQFRMQGGSPRLGATIYFGKSKEWEIKHFKTLNLDLTKLSSNVILRNMREHNEMVATLYRMCVNDSQFVLKERVCWRQRKLRNHLITCVTLLKVIGALHSHLGAGRSHRVVELAPGVEKIMKKIGKNAFRSNVRDFFQLIDDCWGLSAITYAEGACHIHNTFLLGLARVISDHSVFWKESDQKMFIEASLARKLKSFPVQDPTVRQLSSTGGQAMGLLYQLMVNHLNRGKRSRRLKPRRVRS